MRRVALVTHGLEAGGGCSTATMFLWRVLRESGRYEPAVISLATSSVDPWSVRLFSARTWRRGPQVAPRSWQGIPFQHVGAVMTELEFQRYQPRPVLDALLSRFDLVQFVVGVAAWGCVAENVHGVPMAMAVASVVRRDRANRLAASRGPRGLWLRAMSRLTRRLERRALAVAGTVFAMSRYTHENLAPLVGDGRLCLGLIGVDTDVFRPGGAPRAGYLLSVGRFSDPRKNVRLMLAAYRHLCDRLPSVPPLVLAGERPSDRDVGYLRELRLEGRVELPGHVAADALPALYRGAGLFVLSSDEEGLGIGILEAMASGVPVVSTRCGGPETAVEDGETGLMVPVGDARALGDALERVVTDPRLARKMGEAGRARAEARFSLPVTGRAFLDRYEMLLHS